MVFCNPMTCANFGTNIFGGCSLFWVAMAALFFIIVLSRRWIAEAIGMQWSNYGAFGVGYLALIITGVITCSHKFALAAGIIGVFVGAYFGGFLEDSGGGGGY